MQNRQQCPIEICRIMPPMICPCTRIVPRIIVLIRPIFASAHRKANVTVVIITHIKLIVEINSMRLRIQPILNHLGNNLKTFFQIVYLISMTCPSTIVSPDTRRIPKENTPMQRSLPPDFPRLWFPKNQPRRLRWTTCVSAAQTSSPVGDR